jgi:peptidoglycan/LPS O-acetylase OafA/YrhL
MQLVPLLILLDPDSNPTLELLVVRHPLLRLPVFALGVVAGLLEVRGAATEPPWPWPGETSWGQAVDRSGLLLLATVPLSLARAALPGLPRLNSPGQLVLVPLQLVVVRGLARPGDTSRLGRMCRSPALQWAGRHSMAIFLLHDPVLKAAIFRLWLDQEELLTIFGCAAATFVLAPLATRGTEWLAGWILKDSVLALPQRV